MRRVITLILFIAFISHDVRAQTEIKVSPMQLLWRDVHVGAEFAINPNFGLEPRLMFDHTSIQLFDYLVDSERYGLALEAKFYPKPDDGLDRFYTGMYVKGRTGNSVYQDQMILRNRVALGFLAGYKWVSAQNIVAELGVGVGRALYDELLHGEIGASVPISQIPFLRTDFVTRAAIGYRF